MKLVLRRFSRMRAILELSPTKPTSYRRLYREQLAVGTALPSKDHRRTSLAEYIFSVECTLSPKPGFDCEQKLHPWICCCGWSKGATSSLRRRWGRSACTCPSSPSSRPPSALPSSWPSAET